MITITHFPTEPHSLSEMEAVFQKQRFQMAIEWYYCSEANLKVNITLDGEEKHRLEGTLSAWLSANKFQFVVCPMAANRSAQVPGMHRFALSPRPIPNGSQHPVLDKVALLVLATGLLKTGGGVLTIHLCGNGSTLRAAVAVTSRNGIPREADFAFNQLTMRANQGTEWFDYHSEEHANLFTMPYCPEEGASLITGFGGCRQAVPQPETEDITIGHVFNNTAGFQLCFTQENWRSSTCIFGAPGYGKTTLVNSLLAQAYGKQDISFLVIEPKREYRSLKALFPEMMVITSLRGYNPLIPPRGCNSYDWCEVVLEMLSLATPLPGDSPLPDYIRQVYYKAIELRNLDMGFFLLLFDKLMASKHFVGQATNFVTAGRNRLETLFRAFCGANFRKCKARYLDIARLMERPAVIEIGDVPTQKMVSLLTYFVVAHIRMWMRQRPSTNNITNCLVLEEAHSVLSPILNENVRNDIANLLAEGRSRGLSVVVIDQIPSRIDQAATDLCGNAFSLRVTSEKDRNYAAAMLGLQPCELNNLQKHCVVARTNSMFQAETVRVEVDERILQLRPLSNDEIRQISLAENKRRGTATTA